MPTTEILLPSLRGEQTSARLVYLQKGLTTSPLTYLQGKRSKGVVLGDYESLETAKTYRAMLWKFTGRLLAQIDGDFGAVVSPPSRFCDADPYRQAFLSQPAVHATDLTGRFARVGQVLAGESPSLQDLTNALVYSAEGDERTWQSILIVDDTTSSGRSAAALLERLRGAALEKTAKVTIASPLWLPPEEGTGPDA